MFETPRLNARVVRGPRGRLTHLDYRGQENRQGPTLSTACGRTVPANWTTAHHTAATVVPGPGAVELVTCPNCLAWARYHHVAELAAAVDMPELRRTLLATDAANSAARYRELVELLTPAQPATDARYLTADEVTAESERRAATGEPVATLAELEETVAALTPAPVAGCDCAAVPGRHAVHCSDCSAPFDACVCSSAGGDTHHGRSHAMTHPDALDDMLAASGLPPEDQEAVQQHADRLLTGSSEESESDDEPPGAWGPTAEQEAAWDDREGSIGHDPADWPTTYGDAQPRTDAPVAGCDSHNDRGRRAVLRLETARRRADLTAASRALPPAGMP